MTRLSGIYRIVHIATGRSYIGQSADIYRRWRAHLKMLRSGTHHSIALQRCWHKYGDIGFAFEVIEECTSGLTGREQFHIDATGAVLNCARSAGSRLGVPQSAKTRKAIAEKLKGREKSEATRARLSASLTGRRLSAEHCAKIAAVKSVTSGETRARMSSAQRGKSHSLETRDKMRLSQKLRREREQNCHANG